MMTHLFFSSVDPLDGQVPKASSMSARHPFEDATSRSMLLDQQSPMAAEQELLERALLRKQLMAQHQHSQLSSFDGRNAHFVAAAEKAELDALLRHRQQEQQAQFLMASNSGMNTEYAALLRYQDHQAMLAASGRQHLGLGGHHPAYLGVSSLSRGSSVLQKLQQQQEALIEQQLLEEASLRSSLLGRAQCLSGDAAALQVGAFSPYAPTSGAQHHHDAMIHSLLMQRQAEHEALLGNRQAASSQQQHQQQLMGRAAAEAKLSDVVQQHAAIRAAHEEQFLAEVQQHRRLMAEQQDQEQTNQRRSSVASSHASSMSASQRSASSAHNPPPITAVAPLSAIAPTSTKGRDDDSNGSKRSKKKRILAAAEAQQKASPKLAPTKPKPTKTTSRNPTAVKDKDSIVQIFADKEWQETTQKIMKIEDYSGESDEDERAAAAKRKRKPKDQDMPKRPLSAYNLFFKDERARLVQEQEEQEEKEIASSAGGRKKKSGGAGLGFENLAKAIALRWKSVDPQSLERYKKLASSDAERYRQDMEQYRQRCLSGGSNKKSKSSKDEDSV